MIPSYFFRKPRQPSSLKFFYIIIIDPKSGQIRPRAALKGRLYLFLENHFHCFFYLKFFVCDPYLLQAYLLVFFVLLFFYSEKLAIDFVGSCLSKIGQIKPENNLYNSLDKSWRNGENLGPKMSGLYFGPPVKVARIWKRN